MAKSTIEWTEMTWNPTTGCSKISSGCKFCYAETLSKRLKAMGVSKYKAGFGLKLHPSELVQPYKWKKSKMVFVNSMSDLFHQNIPFKFIQEVFKVMNDNTHHIFQILTKRSDILTEYDNNLNWTENIWMGVSIENEEVYNRIEHLRRSHAKVKFLSCEPLLSPLPNLNLQEIDWVIVGGESGQNPRPIKKEWVKSIQQKCIETKIPFFFKQWGGRNKKKAGRLLDGKTYDAVPIISA